MTGEFVIVGWLDFGEHVDAALEAFVACARASRAEPGCLDYVVSADPENAGRVLVLERWAGEDDLAAHFRTAHIERFRAAVEAYPRLGRSLRRYHVTDGADFSSSQVKVS